MEFASELRKLLGNEIVSNDPETLAAHGGDKWFAAHQPDVVVFARSANDVSKLLQFASREKIPVTARGGGFGYVGGCVPARGGIALSLMRMNQIKEISFGDAVAIVEPGVFTADVKAAARAHKLFYPPDPASMKDCTIGGNVATNAGGPRCLKYGVTRASRHISNTAVHPRSWRHFRQWCNLSCSPDLADKIICARAPPLSRLR